MSKMKEVWKGFHKINEEMGELHQALGKLAQHPEGVSPKGKDLINHLEQEIGDVLGVIEYFVYINNLDRDNIGRRKVKKLVKLLTGKYPGIYTND